MSALTLRDGAPSKSRRPSAVSQVFRKISKDRFEVTQPETIPGYRIHVASDRATRTRAYRLAWNVYRASGYAGSTHEGMCCHAYDAWPETLTLLAQTEDGRDAGTITVVFDGHHGLPCDEIFSPEVDSLRVNNRRIAEVTRLALDQNGRKFKELLITLFYHAYQYAHRIIGVTDFAIEVNPRHVGYYTRLFGFDCLGAERPCPRVEGAPALLLHLDLARAKATAQEKCDRPSSPFCKGVYTRFLKSGCDEEVAQKLAAEHVPMSVEDALAFGLEFRVPLAKRTLKASL